MFLGMDGKQFKNSPISKEFFWHSVCCDVNFQLCKTALCMSLNCLKSQLKGDEKIARQPKRKIMERRFDCCSIEYCSLG